MKKILASTRRDFVLKSAGGLLALLVLPNYGLAAPQAPTAQFLERMYREACLPQARNFVTASRALKQLSLNPQASKSQLQAAWKEMLHTWNVLTSIVWPPEVFGIFLKRIDFEPARLARIDETIAAWQRQPAGSANAVDFMEGVSAAAKGISALEQLLWLKQYDEQLAPNRAYIAAVCQALASDAVNLEAALQKAPPKVATPEQTQSSLESWINQWIGGLEQLRWHKMEKSWLAAQTSTTARYSRAMSESVLASWNSLWLSWYDLTSLTPTTPTRLSLCRYLEVSGHTALAQQLNSRCQTAHQTMQSLVARPDWETQMASTIKSLKALQTMAETQVTEAVGITLGFTSADGD